MPTWKRHTVKSPASVTVRGGWATAEGAHLERHAVVEDDRAIVAGRDGLEGTLRLDGDGVEHLGVARDFAARGARVGEEEYPPP